MLRHLCEELNGDDYIAVPFLDDGMTTDNTMEIGYITRRNNILSTVGEQYILHLKQYLNIGEEAE